MKTRACNQGIEDRELEVCFVFKDSQVALQLIVEHKNHSELHLPRAGITGMHHHCQFVLYWGWNPGPHA